jgi:hypothetical protein
MAANDHHSPLLALMNISEELDRYQRRPGEASPELFASRLAICQRCRARRAWNCTAAAQLVTILARQPAAAHACPAHAWPDSPPPAAAADLPAAASIDSSTQSPADRLDAAIIVLSHAYGHWLAEALDSALAQTRPAAEILVVDDASTDSTAAVAAAYAAQGVAYFRHSARDTAASRLAGLRQTTAPVVCFLDADDFLPADYLAAGLPILENAPAVGMVYTDLHQFGDRTDRLILRPGNPHVTNWIHAGSLARRAALEAAGEWGPYDHLTHHDWRLWRALLAAGWQSAKSPAAYHYRRHGASQTAAMNSAAATFAQRAGLAYETLTLFIPLSGRPFGPMADFLERQTWPKHRIRLTLADSSQNAEFSATVRDWLARCDYPDARHYQTAVGPPRVADRPREREPDALAAVRAAMPRLYAHAFQHATTEYVWILEDDVGPPLDCAARLMALFDEQTASVSAAYRSRRPPFEWVAWSTAGSCYQEKPAGKATAVGGNGFGCTIVRKSAAIGVPLQNGRPTADYDPNFYNDLRTGGWRALVDWSTEAQHPYPSPGAPNDAP